MTKGYYHASVTAPPLVRLKKEILPHIKFRKGGIWQQINKKTIHILLKDELKKAFMF